jgi:hypothetical protein
MSVHKEGYRWAEPGARAEASCPICGARCEIHRNSSGQRLGPRASPAASACMTRSPARTPVWVGTTKPPSCTEGRPPRPTPTLAAILRSDLETLVRQHGRTS